MDIWDGVHAGLEAATLVRASQAQHSLASMQATAANEAARRELIEVMKNEIFTLSTAVTNLERQLSDHPEQIYIAGRLLDRELKESDISVQALPDIQDKEYFVKTQKRLAELIETSQKGMAQEERDQADKLLQCAWELPLLKEAIPAKAAQESLIESEAKWRKCSAHQNKKSTFKILGIVGLVSTVVMACPMLFFTAALLKGNSMGSKLMGLMMFAIGAAIPVGAIALLVLGAKSNREYPILKAKRDAWQQQQGSNQDWQKIKSIFGDLSSAQYQNLYEKHLAYISSIAGEGDLSKMLMGQCE